MTILAATGLRREARIVEGPGVTAIAGGGRGPALEAALMSAAAGAQGLISIGIAGALAPDLQAGDWVVATQVLAGGAVTPTDPAWTGEILRRLSGSRAGAILGADDMLTAATHKRAAYDSVGALAVDMESHVTARVARRLGLPFAAFRAISDGADRDLPAAVTVGMKPNGDMALGAVLASLAGDPWQLPALLRAARDAERAFRALTDARRLLGAGLGRPDFLELPLDVG